MVHKPRLNDAIIHAAAIGHYGKKRVGKLTIDGIDLTVDNREYSFRHGFTRMWHAAWAEIERRDRATLNERGE